MLLRGLDVGGNHVPALSNTDVLASTPCRIETFLSVIISFVENSSLAVVQTRLTTWGIAGYEAAIEVNTGPYWKYYFICSAYCGGLWLASLRVMQEIATILGFPDEATKYLKILNNGKKAYHSLLWNGKMLLKFWYYSGTKFKVLCRTWTHKTEVFVFETNSFVRWHPSCCLPLSFSSAA